MGYYIDLKSISIDDYKSKLESMYLVKSRLILKEKLNERFGYFKKAGINNVFELQETLKKKNKFADLAKVPVFSDDYLTILLREINSIQPKPNKITEFPGISKDVVFKLEKIGIKDTVKLYGHILTKALRKEIAAQTGLNEKEIVELTKLTDLSRIKWVGATFARVLYEAGYDTVEKVSQANHEDLYNKVNQLKKEKDLYKGQIGLNDMLVCVNAAKEVQLEIEY